MLDLSQAFFQEDDEDDFDSFDDLDELFSNLETFVPPANMVERIMGAVSRLPLPQVMQDKRDQDLPEHNGLVVRREHRLPS